MADVFLIDQQIRTGKNTAKGDDATKPAKAGDDDVAGSLLRLSHGTTTSGPIVDADFEAFTQWIKLLVPAGGARPKALSGFWWANAVVAATACGGIGVWRPGYERPPPLAWANSHPVRMKVGGNDVSLYSLKRAFDNPGRFLVQLPPTGSTVHGGTYVDKRDEVQCDELRGLGRS
jgi:hypothetical protein